MGCAPLENLNHENEEKCRGKKEPESTEYSAILLSIFIPKYKRKETTLATLEVVLIAPNFCAKILPSESDEGKTSTILIFPLALFRFDHHAKHSVRRIFLIQKITLGDEFIWIVIFVIKKKRKEEARIKKKSTRRAPQYHECQDERKNERMENSRAKRKRETYNILVFIINDRTEKITML